MLSTPQKVTVKTIHVNTLCEDIHQNRTAVLNRILCEIVLSHQVSKLASDIGPRYSREKVTASFCCTVCGKRYFIRKGKRFRMYKSVLGKSKIPILQVQCCCGHRFCPYKDEIGLAFTERISPALKQRQLELTPVIFRTGKPEMLLSRVLMFGLPQPRSEKRSIRRPSRSGASP